MKGITPSIQHKAGSLSSFSISFFLIVIFFFEIVNDIFYLQHSFKELFVQSSMRFSFPISIFSTLVSASFSHIQRRH